MASNTLFLRAALCAAFSVLAGCSHPPGQGTGPSAADVANHAGDIGALARQASSALWQQRDPAAVDRYVAPGFVEHDPRRGGDIAALRRHAALVSQQPGVKWRVQRTVVEGDLVALHGRLEGLADTPPLVVVDLYRFKGGKIIEHWGASQPEAAPNPSGRTQLDGETTVTDLDKTEANRQVVKDLMEALSREELGRLGEFLDAANYRQHNTRIGDGIAPLQAMLAGLFKSAPKPHVHVSHRYIAQGNFVVVQVESRMGPNTVAIYDLFRLENGKIVEHWDVLHPLPPRAQWLNDNGPF